LGEGIFARPPVLGGGWVCVAEGDAQVSQSFVQKRFSLRPIIANSVSAGRRNKWRVHNFQ